MRTIKRVMVATALAVPLTFGFAGVASADTSFDQNCSWAGPDGASACHVHSSTGNGDGHGHGHGSSSSFKQSMSSANADGAMEEIIRSHADSHGDVHFHESMGMSGADGAASSETNSRAGN